jgi:Icc-related predicted phosphoesterase
MPVARAAIGGNVACDLARRQYSEHMGYSALAEMVLYMQPQQYVFGHIHE